MTEFAPYRPQTNYRANLISFLSRKKVIRRRGRCQLVAVSHGCRASHGGFSVSADDFVKPSEVLAVREEPFGDLDLWRLCLLEAMCVVTARETGTGRLLGIGFLVGNSRHAQIVDLQVHSAYRRLGIARAIGKELLLQAKQRDIQFLGLTYDERKPWLKVVYRRYGFRVVSFAMWHEESLARLRRRR